MQPFLVRGGMKTDIRDAGEAPNSTYLGRPVHPIRARIHRTRIGKAPENAEMRAFPPIQDERQRLSYPERRFWSFARR
jgi:hypothetical protein